MPEGDSVYRLARRLDRKLRGHTIARSDLRVPRLATADLAGRQILQHATHGKHLLTRFSGGVTLHSHLLMDGEWTVTGPGKRLPRRLMPDVRVVLATVEGLTGWGLRVHRLELVPSADEHRLVGHLGPDPLHDDFDPAEAERRLRAEPDVPVVSALLDQTKVAGFGNLWVNELAFLAGVSPWTPVGDVDVGRAGPHGAPPLRDHARRCADHHRADPEGRAALGVRSCAEAVPAVRDRDQGCRRARQRRRQPAHVVVPALPARSWT